MTKRRDLSPDEAKLWRKVAKSTKAYKTLPIVETPPVVFPAAASVVPAPELPHVALKRLKAQRMASVIAPRLAALTKSLTPVPNAAGHKKVRRGKLDIDARIDLHGMRQIEAQTALSGIIARTRVENGRCVLVVTGKGMPIDPGEDFITPQPGVIRRRLPEWLNSSGIREHVSGFAPAHPKDGGNGAFYVLLKARPKS